MFLRFLTVRFFIGAIALISAIFVSGCLDPPLKELNPCLISGVIIDQDVDKVDKIDLLFVVDNSQSMEQEQAKLRDQIPRMIKVLATGDKTPDDGVENKDFPPVKDLHLAVVSSDMGLPGVPPDQNPDSTGACNGNGDDGNFLNDTTEAVKVGLSCGTYPLFLQHVRDENEQTSATLQRAQATADAFECISTLGTSGCGFEMQLESPLKALWPSQAQYLTQSHLDVQISFLSGSQGRGDIDHRSFLRGTPYHPDEADKLSLLAIVVVTDEEDCSAGALGNLDFLSLNFPAGDRRDLNLRCYNDTLNNWGNKYPVERYINGFKALRPEFSDLVVFAAIAGIPPEVEEDTDNNGDISPEEREKFYDTVLNHQFMQEVPNPDTNNLNFSCVHPDPNIPGDNDTEAFPARRITEVAKGFGANGVIRSICSDDFSPAMKAIINVIANKIGGVCLPQAYTRDSAGEVGCDIIWTLPPGDTTCEGYLSDPEEDKPQVDEETGRKLCVVHQIPVLNTETDDPAVALAPNQLGWYYDDFSADMKRTCKITETTPTQQRISFTLHAGMGGQNEDPPAGVSIDLECLAQIPTPISDPETSKVGKACEEETADSMLVQRCDPSASVAEGDVGKIFCHDVNNVCVMYCKSDADCKKNKLAGWVCDKRKNASGYVNKSALPICVNPTCG